MSANINSGVGPILYPNVSSIPKSPNSRVSGGAENGVPGEFDVMLDQYRDLDLASAKVPLKFSAHASQRMQDRKLQLDPGMMAKLSSAVDKAEAKGLDDTLVLTPDAAYIVSAKNRTVITAMDRDALSGNVFTNIDGAVIV